MSKTDIDAAIGAFALTLAENLDKRAAHHEDEGRRWATVDIVTSRNDYARAKTLREIAEIVRASAPTVPRV